MEDDGISNDPMSRLTRLCETMCHAMEDSPDHTDDVRGFICLTDTKKGGIVFFGYEHGDDLMDDMLMHFGRMLKSAGASIVVVAPEDGTWN